MAIGISERASTESPPIQDQTCVLNQTKVQGNCRCQSSATKSGRAPWKLGQQFMGHLSTSKGCWGCTRASTRNWVANRYSTQSVGVDSKKYSRILHKRCENYLIAIRARVSVWERRFSLAPCVWVRCEIYGHLGKTPNRSQHRQWSCLLQVAWPTVWSRWVQVVSLNGRVYYYYNICIYTHPLYVHVN